MNTEITDIQAWEILDSRGNPTLSVELMTQGGASGIASVPSGASTGVLEALELRDSDMTRYLGKGVLTAIEHVNTILKQSVLGHDAADQERLDRHMIEMDGTDNKRVLGANAILAVSLAAAHASARARRIPLYAHLSELYDCRELILPVPQMNIINGGAHADNAIDFQEFMILPVGFERYAEALRCGVEIFHALKQVLLEKGYSTGVGDEGGFAPECRSNEEAIILILQAIERSGYMPGEQVMIGVDAASSEFYSADHYRMASEGAVLDSGEFASYLERWVSRYPVISIEDGMAEQDWTGWDSLTRLMGKRIQLTGDDLFVTNPDILRKGIERGVANSILIKLNQVGTLTETFHAMAMARQAGYGITVSHRSGETEDTTIADLAVATAAGQIKTGSLCRSERVCKYNRLLKIERDLGDHACYAGTGAFSFLKQPD